MLKWRYLILVPCLLVTFCVIAQNEALDEISDSETVEVDYDFNFTLEEGEELPRSDAAKKYHSEIKDILAGDDYARAETVERWRFKELDENEKEERREKYPEWLISFIEALEGDGSTLISMSKAFEVFLWALLIALIAFSIFRYRKQLLGVFAGFEGQSDEPELPSNMFGLDLKADSMPTDTLQAARMNWTNQQRREAIAILLRASLVKLLNSYSCRFFDSDTEAECCDRIDRQAPRTIALYMRKLVTAWQSIAYAHVEPSDDAFEHLCEQWSKVFQ